MFGIDRAVRGEEAVFDVGEHGVRPAEGGVACGGAIGLITRYGNTNYLRVIGLLELLIDPTRSAFLDIGYAAGIVHALWSGIF